jgi:hypothetical protein
VSECPRPIGVSKEKLPELLGNKGSNSQDISMTPKTTDLRGDCWGIDGLLGGGASQIGRNMRVFLR